MSPAPRKPVVEEPEVSVKGEPKVSTREPETKAEPEVRAEKPSETPGRPVEAKEVPKDPYPQEKPEAAVAPLERVVEAPLENRTERVHSHAPAWFPREPNSGW